MATLPIKLPVAIGRNNSNGLITLPVTLPITFGNNNSNIKIKIPVYETVSTFDGIIFEENIVETMNESILLVEDIRSRILIDAELLDKNTVRLHWYGDKVPEVEVYKKLEIDDNYEKIGIYPWEQSYTDIVLDGDSYNIKLEGTGNSGQSGIVTIGETFFININTNLILPVNEKNYYLDVDFVSKFNIKVDF